jgi:hypothetical protein
MGLAAHAQIQYNGQIGFDAWDIDTSTNNPKHERLLFLANSTPQWQYRNPSPWIRFDAQTALTDQLSANVKFRGGQSSDWRVDELNLNWEISPHLALAAGIVDYKLSWCRVYDVESPWARENDPFCTTRSTDQGVGAAPGIQIFNQAMSGRWFFQSSIGAYNPLLLDYNKKDFSNTTLIGQSRVTKNQRYGVNLSALHTPTATEFRIGQQILDQTARYDLWNGVAPLTDFHKSGTVTFAGVAFTALPNWQLRLTALDSKIHGNWEDLIWDGQWAQTMKRKSLSIESIHRVNSTNTLAFAMSEYRIYVDDYEKISRTAYPTDFLVNKLYSVAWRKEWQKGFFTVIQASRSESNLSFFDIGSDNIHGTAYGARLGWRF